MFVNVMIVFIWTSSDSPQRTYNTYNNTVIAYILSKYRQLKLNSNLIYNIKWPKGRKMAYKTLGGMWVVEAHTQLTNLNKKSPTHQLIDVWPPTLHLIFASSWGIVQKKESPHSNQKLAFGLVNPKSAFNREFNWIYCTHHFASQKSPALSLASLILEGKETKTTPEESCLVLTATPHVQRETTVKCDLYDLHASLTKSTINQDFYTQSKNQT